MTDISTCDLCDAYPDEVQVAEPILRSFGGRRAFGGQVVVIQCHEDNSLVRDAVAEPGNGRVLVVDGDGSVRRSLLGDQLAANAVKNGWAGVVVHGAIRDVDVIATLDLGVMALAPVPMKTEKRGMGDRDVSVRFAGITVRAGMYLYADNDGLIVADRDLLSDGTADDA